MSIEQTFSQIRKRFMLTTIGLSVLSVIGLAFVLYELNAIRFDQRITSQQLHSVVEGNNDVQAYLEQEKDFEAHFVTIANLVRADQQRTLAQAILVLAGPTIIIAAVAGYLVARRLLTPVEEAYQSQERFLQDAAHELRNPLAAMSATLQNAKNTGRFSKGTLLTLERQTKRLSRINEDLLFLERHPSGQIMSELNLSELMHDVLESLQHEANRKRLQLKTDIEDNLTRRMHQEDFLRVAKNIIENAIKYTPEGGKIKISLKKARNGMELKVVDTGIGISPDDLTHLGERFFRGNNVKDEDGTGLGLAIVDKLVKRYGGNISINSQLGKGTAVTINI